MKSKRKARKDGDLGHFLKKELINNSRTEDKKKENRVRSEMTKGSAEWKVQKIKEFYLCLVFDSTEMFTMFLSHFELCDILTFKHSSKY